MKKSILGLGLAAACLPAIATAQGFYAGGSLGTTEYKTDDSLKSDLDALGVSLDDTDTGIKGFGGYRVNPYLAFESALVSFGEIEAETAGNSVTVSAASISAVAVGILPLTESFELFAKGGLHFWGSETESDIPGVRDEDDDGSDFTYGFGVQYNINKHFTVRGEFENYEFDDDEDVEFISVGLAYNF